MAVHLHPLDPTPRYVFVDGNCLMLEFRRILEEVHGEAPNLIDFDAMRSELGAQRVFWYDSVLDVDAVRDVDQLPAEKVAEAHKKSLARTEYLEHVQTKDGFLVRTGTSRGIRRKNGIEIREKEVDVLLAVDSLLQAANGNVKHAIIIGGDLDHRPVAEALMQLGVYVTIYGHARTSSEFRLASDSFRPFDYFVAYSWAGYNWKEKHPEVSKTGRSTGGYSKSHVGKLNRNGEFDDETVVLEYMGAVSGHQGYRMADQTTTFRSKDPEALKKFLASFHGPIDWTE